MANIKSQKKRIITNEKSRLRNRAIKSELKTAVRSVREAVEAENGADAYVAAMAACRLLDKAVSKGVIHKKQAANRKHGIMMLVNPIVSDKDKEAYKKPAPKKTTPGSKKAQRKEERKAELEKKNQEKEKRRQAQKKAESAAAKKKAAAAKKAEEEAAASEEAESE